MVTHRVRCGGVQKAVCTLEGCRQSRELPAVFHTSLYCEYEMSVMELEDSGVCTAQGDIQDEGKDWVLQRNRSKSSIFISLLYHSGDNPPRTGVSPFSSST